SKNKYGIEIIHKGHEEAVEKVTNSIVFLGYIILTSVFILSAVFFIGSGNISHINQIPFLSWLFFTFGTISFLNGFRKI
ncbi:MAG: hypothetical protein ACHQYQ_03475, partial [Bacteriovoracales bacterium]